MCPTWQIPLILTIILLSNSFLASTNSRNCETVDEAKAGHYLQDRDQPKLPCTVWSSYSEQLALTKTSHTIKIITLGNRVADYFTVDPHNYTLMMRRQLDREILCPSLSLCCRQMSPCVVTFNMAIMPKENKDDALGGSTKFTKITVRINDINDNAPSFQSPAKLIELAESTRVGYRISLPPATDPDSEDNNILKYDLESEGDATFELFSDSRSSDLKRLYLELKKPLDRETKATYSLKLIAQDKGQPPKLGILKITIIVLDENDNFPTFSNRSYSATVSENIPVGFRLLRVQATDPDHGENGRILYSINANMDPLIQRTFMLDSDTGWLTISNRLNYEARSTFSFTVEARDRGGHTNKDEAIVNIFVTDENDTPPQINIQYLDGSKNRVIKEGMQAKKVVAFMSVVDPDQGRGGKVSCHINDNNKFLLQKAFANDEKNYQIILSGELDYETRPFEIFTICCTDEGLQPLDTCQSIKLYVEDVNDCAPEFKQSYIKIPVEENNIADVVIGRLEATDRDSGENSRIRYSIDAQSQRNFVIGQIDGLLRPKIKFDREQEAQYTVKVFATDHGTPALTGSTTLDIQIMDKNDNSPTFIGAAANFQSFQFEVEENQSVNTFICHITAVDPDIGNNGKVTYSLSPPSALFSINSVTGSLITKAELDREKQSHYALTVLAVDQGQPPHSSSATVTIKVLDINDHPPRIIFPSRRNNSIKVSYREKVGQVVARIEARDEDLGTNALLEYQVVSGNQLKLFRIDITTGELIINRPMEERHLDMYQLRIKVQDQGVPKLAEMVDLLVQLDNSPPKFNHPDMSHKRSGGLGLENSAILIVIVALICVIILVLLSITLYLCGRKGLLPFYLLNRQFKRRESTYTSRPMMRSRQYESEIDDEVNSEIMNTLMTTNSRYSNQYKFPPLSSREEIVPLHHGSSFYSTLQNPKRKDPVTPTMTKSTMLPAMSSYAPSESRLQNNLCSACDHDEEQHKRIITFLRQCSHPPGRTVKEGKHSSTTGTCSSDQEAPTISSHCTESPFRRDRTASLGRLDLCRDEAPPPNHQYYTIQCALPTTKCPKSKCPHSKSKHSAGHLIYVLKNSPSFPEQLNLVPAADRSSQSESYDPLETSGHCTAASPDLTDEGSRVYGMTKGSFV